MTTNEMQPLNRYDLQQCTRRMPKEVLQLLKTYPRQACVAGGFIRAVVANEKVSDIDIFASCHKHAQDMADMLSLGAESLTQLEAFRATKEAGGMLKDKPRTIIRTDNALTVRGFYIDPQIVHRWTFADVMDVAQSFDFTIACALIFWCDRLNAWQGFCDERFYQDLAAKRLVYRSPVRNEDAGGSLLRVLKFYQRGYRIPLDSLGAVIARTVKDIDMKGLEILGHNVGGQEKALAKIITGLLVEVDPLLDPSHAAHVPSLAD